MIYVAISREITEERAGIGLSGPLKSEARVAGFLEELAKRHAALGYSSQEMSLPMTRRDIGCYLGLTLETVSRALSRLAREGLIRFADSARREIVIPDVDALGEFVQDALAPAAPLQ